MGIKCPHWSPGNTLGPSPPQSTCHALHRMFPGAAASSRGPGPPGPLSGHLLHLRGPQLSAQPRTRPPFEHEADRSLRWLWRGPSPSSGCHVAAKALQEGLPSLPRSADAVPAALPLRALASRSSVTACRTLGGLSQHTYSPVLLEAGTPRWVPRPGCPQGCVPRGPPGENLASGFWRWPAFFDLWPLPCLPDSCPIPDPRLRAPTLTLLPLLRSPWDQLGLPWGSRVVPQLGLLSRSLCHSRWW